MKETTLQTPRLVKQDREVFQVPGERYPCCGEDHSETDCPSAAHGNPWGSRYPSAAHGRSHVRADGCLKMAVTYGNPTLELIPSRTCGPVERGAHTGVD